jgi:MFS family permease
VGSANVGELIGLLINGWVSERFGYRWTVIGCLVLVIAWTAIFFTAQNVVALLVAEILCGIVSTLSGTFVMDSSLISCSPGVSSRRFALLMPLKSARLLCAVT